jgi:hypothetical protein
MVGGLYPTHLHFIYLRRIRNFSYSLDIAILLHNTSKCKNITYGHSLYYLDATETTI